MYQQLYRGDPAIGSPHRGATSFTTNARYAAMKAFHSRPCAISLNARRSSPGRIARLQSLGIFQPACRNACMSFRYVGGSSGRPSA